MQLRCVSIDTDLACLFGGASRFTSTLVTGGIAVVMSGNKDKDAPSQYIDGKVDSDIPGVKAI